MKQLFMSLTFLMSLFFIQNIALANQLSPFGDFDWSDNVINIFSKLKNISSLQKIYIQASGTEHFSNVNYLGKENSDLIAGIRESIKNNSKDWKFKERNKEIILTNGRKSLYHRITDFKITASPVILSGVPFEVNFSFKNVPGYVITNLDKAIKFNIDGKEILFLLQFEKMEFLALDRELSLKQQEKLFKIMTNKYPKMKNDFGDECKKLSDYRYYCTTTDGDFSIGFRSPSPYQMGIIYKNSLEYAENIYKNHRNNILSNELKGNDSSSDL